MTRIIFADRQRLADLVDRYSLAEIMRELSLIWDERSEGFRPGTEEWQRAILRRGIAADAADEIARVVNRARSELRVLVRESTQIAHEMARDVGL